MKFNSKEKIPNKIQARICNSNHNIYAENIVVGLINKESFLNIDFS